VKELFDEREVEDFFEHDNVIFNWVDDFYIQVSVFLRSNVRQIDLCKIIAYFRRIYFWKVGHLILLNGLSDVINVVGNIFRRRGTTGEIVLDAEIGIWTYINVNLI
jgi:hypothetical protein